jgi:hypothetical protein
VTKVCTIDVELLKPSKYTMISLDDLKTEPPTLLLKTGFVTVLKSTRFFLSFWLFLFDEAIVE